MSEIHLTRFQLRELYYYFHIKKFIRYGKAIGKTYELARADMEHYRILAEMSR